MIRIAIILSALAACCGVAYFQFPFSTREYESSGFVVRVLQPKPARARRPTIVLLSGFSDAEKSRFARIIAESNMRAVYFETNDRPIEAPNEPKILYCC